MEKKLAEFRARRQAENSLKKETKVDPTPEIESDGKKEEEEEEEEEEDSELISSSSVASESPAGRDWLLDSSLGRWLASKHFIVSNVFLLKLLLWLVLLGLFVELEFGLPFFVVSLFFWLYEGLRSPAPREPGELSAYSVFNPGCQTLLGSLTAEQLEGEMGYRPLANR